MAKKEYIFTIVAHPDDQILGPGGTLAKMVREGKNVLTIICSYGELSHPHFKKEVIRNLRAEESLKADKVIGGSGIEFLDLREGKFEQDFKDKHIAKKFTELFDKYRPTKVFTHALTESHPDHVLLTKLLLEWYDQYKEKRDYTTEIYTFTVWSLFNFKHRHYPRLVVDVSDTFSTKLKALSFFKSQLLTMINIKWTVYTKAFIAGLRRGVSFAEEFYRLR